MRIVAGRFRGKSLKSPKDSTIRPTTDRVREALFNILASRLGPHLEGKRVLDLFAGTGALGLEALSRGASQVVFVDKGVESRALLRDHVQEFGVAGQARILKRDATSLGKIEKFRPFDLVFLDPPYGLGLGGKALENARDGGWLNPGALVVWEERRDAEVTPPAGFTLEDRREYGDTAMTFLTFSG